MHEKSILSVGCGEIPKDPAELLKNFHTLTDLCDFRDIREVKGLWNQDSEDLEAMASA